jgi:hypothetical protein
MKVTASHIAKLDRLIADATALRAEMVAEDCSAEPSENSPADLSPENMVDVATAAARFNFPQDTIRKLAAGGRRAWPNDRRALDNFHSQAKATDCWALTKSRCRVCCVAFQLTTSL